MSTCYRKIGLTVESSVLLDASRVGKHAGISNLTLSVQRMIVLNFTPKGASMKSKFAILIAATAALSALGAANATASVLYSYTGNPFFPTPSRTSIHY